MTTKLNHIALNIYEVNDVTDFYQDILGFHPEYQFELPATLSHTIFGINQRRVNQSLRFFNQIIMVIIHI